VLEVLGWTRCGSPSGAGTFTDGTVRGLS